MSYRSKSQHFVTCDVCEEVETSIGQKSDEDALAFATSNGWKPFPGRHQYHPWHACPACHNSQEFHIGLPAAKALIDMAIPPHRAWSQVNALVQAGLIVEPSESESTG